MLEELAVGAQHRIPYVHVLVNNSYLGLIRQAQRNFDRVLERPNQPSGERSYLDAGHSLRVTGDYLFQL